MDLADLDVTKAAEEGAMLHLMHPVYVTPIFLEEGKPSRIKLCGIDSKRFRKAQVKADEKKREKTRNLGRILTEDEKIELDTEVLVSIILEWENIRYKSEKTMDFTFENAKRLLTEQVWVREQITRFITDRANFWKEPQKA